MPDLRGDLISQLGESLDLVRAAEAASASMPAGSQLRRDFGAYKLHLIHELAFLRIFLAWEEFLEETFVRYMCGYSAQGTVENLSGGRFATITSARQALYGGRQYILWHDPTRNAQRCAQFVAGGRHEVAMHVWQPRLEHFAAIRHRVAHSQEDARVKFDQAAIRLAQRRYPRSRPGRLLRDWSTSVPPVRYLTVFARDFRTIASQIA